MRAFATPEPGKIAFNVSRTRRELGHNSVEPARFGGAAKAMLHQGRAIHGMRHARCVQRALEFFHVRRLGFRWRPQVEPLFHDRVNRRGFVEAPSRFKHQRTRHIRQGRGHVAEPAIDALDPLVRVAFNRKQEGLQQVGEPAIHASWRRRQNGARIGCAPGGQIVGKHQDRPDRFIVATLARDACFTGEVIEVGGEQGIAWEIVGAIGRCVWRRGGRQHGGRLMGRRVRRRRSRLLGRGGVGDGRAKSRNRKTGRQERSTHIRYLSRLLA